MEKENRYKFFAYILIGVLILGWVRFNNLKEKNTVLTDEVDEYQYALARANENIEEANSNIEDARNYAWSTYDEMGISLITSILSIRFQHHNLYNR